MLRTSTSSCDGGAINFTNVTPLRHYNNTQCIHVDIMALPFKMQMKWVAHSYSD